MANERPSARLSQAVRYRWISQQLREQIAAGRYLPGDRLPTEMELAALYSVSRTTTAAALSELAREGLVDRAPRRGTTVRSQPPAGAGPRQGAHPLIAWIQPAVDYAHGLPLLRGVEQAARQAGYGLLLATTDKSMEGEEEAIRRALATGVAGLALFPQDGESFNAVVLRLFLDRFPVVLVDRYFRGVACASVQSDNVAGARAIVEELTHAHHRHICALVHPPVATSAILDRLDGYAQALAAAGIPLDSSLIYESDALCGVDITGELPDEVVEHFAAYLRDRPHVTAVFASNAPLALLTLRAAERLHLCIPADLSLVCIDALHTLPLPLPSVTYAHQQGHEIGRAAVGLLKEQLAGKLPRRIVLPMVVERRGSVAPPRARS